MQLLASLLESEDVIEASLRPHFALIGQTLQRLLAARIVSAGAGGAAAPTKEGIMNPTGWTILLVLTGCEATKDADTGAGDAASDGTEAAVTRRSVSWPRRCSSGRSSCTLRSASQSASK